MSEEASVWVKIGGVAAAGLGVMIGTFRGVFITRKECANKSQLCVNGIREELVEIKQTMKENQEAVENKIAKGHEKVENIEKYTMALALNAGIKLEDLPKI